MKGTILILVGALLAILSPGCTHKVLNSENTFDPETPDQHRQVASSRAGVGIVGSDRSVFIFRKDKDTIVIEQCLDFRDLKRPDGCGERAQLPVVEISVSQFKELLKIALMVPADYADNVKEKIDLFKEKLINTESLKKKKVQLEKEIQQLVEFDRKHKQGHSESEISSKQYELAGIEKKIFHNKEISAANKKMTEDIEKLVNKVIGDSNFQDFNFSQDSQSFEFNILWSYVKMPGLFKGWEYSKIKGGNFKMGNLTLKTEDDKGEVPHPVELTNDFEIQQTEVTQAQWLAVMGHNPSKFQNYADKEKKDPHCKDLLRKQGVTLCLNHPVEQVSWHQVQEFIKKVNSWDQKYTYRLPTEAEWEYAARGHSEAGLGDAVVENNAKQVYFFGGDSSNLGLYAWYRGNSGRRTQPVATKEPNSNQLYDVYGNVSEWVQDWYGRLPSKFQRNPVGPATGDARVIRNGYWNSEGSELYSAKRHSARPGFSNDNLGFRLVRTAK